MLLANDSPPEPQDLGVDIPANFPFLISILQFQIRNFPSPVPNHNVPPFSAVTGKVNQRSINSSRLSPQLSLPAVSQERMRVAYPPSPGMPLNGRPLSLDLESRALNLQIPTKQAP